MSDLAYAEPATGVGVAASPGSAAAVVSPYALVRLASLVPPPDPEPTTELRLLTERAVQRHREAELAGSLLADVLHDLAANATAPLRRIVLALRRDVHNQRTPRPAVRAALADLPGRVDHLADWLSARDDLDRLAVEIAARTEQAIRAERRALGACCRREEFRRAVALTGEDLLRAIDRAALCGDAPDKRARKSEATVLRYVARATTKTSPLSWFTYSAWGSWLDPDAGPDDADLDGALELVSASEPDRGAVDALINAALAKSGRRDLALQVEPGLRIEGGRALFRRPAAVGEYGTVIQREEELSVPVTAVLTFVLGRCSAGSLVRPDELADAVAARLPLDPHEAARVSSAYVAGLVEQGLLRPALPLDPQAESAIPRASAWLASVGAREPARLLERIGQVSGDFSVVAATKRPERLAELRGLWHDAFRTVDAEPSLRRMPVTEDVSLASPVRLGDRMGRGARDSIARLAPLFEAFDLFAVVRRAARDRFVQRYGDGGCCDSIAQFAVDYADVWRDAELVGPGGIAAAGRSLGPGLDELAGLRRHLSELARRAPVNDGELVLPDQVAADAAQFLPGWLSARPASYAVFAQPAPRPESTQLCVNRVYGGWGRFTSRFLPAFGPAAARQVTDQISAVIGPDARLAQIRPVGGFNANLHPLLVGEEVGEHQGPNVIHPGKLQLVHDRGTDQLRLRHRVSGELIDLLYLGFLVPVALPERLVPLLNDLGTGLVDVLSPLRPATTRETRVGPVQVRPRLRYRDVVLGRRQWRLGADTVERWRSELSADPQAGLAIVARWRAELGLPEQVFVAGAAGGQGADLTALLDYLDAPKPQYVDLGAALHVHCLGRTLARYPSGVVVEEALPAPQAGRRCVEIMLETYRRAS